MSPPSKESSAKNVEKLLQYAIFIVTLLGASAAFVAAASRASGMDTVTARMEADRALMEEIRLLGKDVKEQTLIQRGMMEQLKMLNESNSLLTAKLDRHMEKK